MSRATTIKEAIEKWEAREGKSAATATDVGLQFQYPPIEKLTVDIGVLVNCQKLSLSTNSIDRIILSPSLKNLKILALGRNNIVSLNGLDVVGETLEELWISYNLIKKLDGIENMKKLKVFYMSNNNVSDWNELSKLTSLRNSLESLIFLGNPLAESMDEADYRSEAIRRLPFLKELDGVPIFENEV